MVMVKAGHELVLRVERNGVVSGPGPAFEFEIETGLGSGRKQCPFHRVTFDHPLAIRFVQAGITAEEGGAAYFGEQRVFAGICIASVQRKAAAWRIPGAADRKEPPGGRDRGDGHFIARQRACLVGTDDRDRSQCLDGREPADDRVSACHALHADRQGNGQNGREAFRDGRDRQSDHRHEDFGKTEVADQQAEDQHKRGDAEDRGGQPLGEDAHLP